MTFHFGYIMLKMKLGLVGHLLRTYVYVICLTFVMSFGSILGLTFVRGTSWLAFYSFFELFFRTLEPQPQKHLVVCPSAFLPFPSFLFAKTMPPPPGKKYKSELWSHFTVSNANSKGQAVKVCAYREHALLCWCNVLQH